MRSPRFLVVVGVAAVLGTSGIAVAARRSSSSRVAAPNVAAVPLSYHVVYRVTSGSVVNTEDLWVHRPFDAEDTTYAGTATTGTPISRIVTRLGRQQLRNAGGEAAVLEPSPAPTPFDTRLDAVTGYEPASNALVVMSTTRVAGRDCRVYRSARSLSTAALIAAPTAANHVDTCVDAQGIVLDERQVTDGKVVLVRRAAAVQAGGASATHKFLTSGAHVPLNDGGGRVVSISDGSRVPGQASWELPAAPNGFTHLGRFAVVPPQPRASASSPPTAALVTAVDDVFVRGPDVIVIEQGQTTGGRSPVLPTGGQAVDLGALGSGQLLVSSLASSITAPAAGSNGYVRVSGTVTPRLLLHVARSLAQQPAGTLVTIPDVATDGA